MYVLCMYILHRPESGIAGDNPRELSNMRITLRVKALLNTHSSPPLLYYSDLMHTSKSDKIARYVEYCSRTRPHRTFPPPPSNIPMFGHELSPVSSSLLRFQCSQLLTQKPQCLMVIRHLLIYFACGSRGLLSGPCRPMAHLYDSRRSSSRRSSRRSSSSRSRSRIYIIII